MGYVAMSFRRGYTGVYNEIWWFFIYHPRRPFPYQKIQSTLDNYVQGEQIIEKLVKEAIDKLKDVKKNKGEEPFLTTVQLRATLLSDIPNIKEQNNLWAQTKEKIMKEQSENIELYLLEENGEIMTCWEWKE